VSAIPHAPLTYGRRTTGEPSPQTAGAAADEPRCLVIVPAFNEADSIAGVIDDLRRHVPHYDVLIVDDGSTDNTAQAARHHARPEQNDDHASGRLFVLSLPFNLGIGGAVQTGYRFAARHGYDAAIQVDGDGQHPARELPRLIRTLRQTGANLVIGSRFLQPRADDDPTPDMQGQPAAYLPPPSRMLGIRVLRLLIRLITGERCTDPTSGLRAADARLVAAFAHWYPDDYPEPEVVVLLHQAGFTFTETPVHMNARAGGQTSIPLHRGLFYVVKVSVALLLDTVRRPWPPIAPDAAPERSQSAGSSPDHLP
jgi:glycosyltransferase involved in cell wall biosynthesis